MNDFYDNLTLTINRAINYYLYENQDNALNNIYVYGGGVHFEQLFNKIKNELNLNVLNFQEEKDFLSALGATL